ncbi:uncharacterized protein Triagg1_2933 [Trichoderma aggressivum f. europaeum]|uniref:Uncharacterized protein n=1 Tax=Trichoderma aggressivum f. europaeum TaxID=173218 RepID=A0AAE1M0W0_9HYPO|nr:hypothetical protein Triagg1_2933 [Trichoderma aggressivum f. europaeum]
MNNSRAAPDSYGTNGADPPVLPVAASQLQIIFEWVGLLPLAIYLSGSGLSHWLVGQTSLAGFIGVSLFPRLGILDNLAAFLHESANFLDRASSVSELRHTVWDANWGSVFPCANGAASDILTRYVIPTARDIEIPTDLAALIAADELGRNSEKGKGNAVTAEASNNSTSHTNEDAGGSQFRRYQTLYILDCTIDAAKRKNKSPSATCLFFLMEVLFILSLLGACVSTILFGLYGTAAAILISIAFRVARQCIKVITPPRYLESNEANHADAYMLTAIHENSSTWYLFRGSRAVVDGLLNKPMILDITARHKTTVALALRGLAALQLLAMTYVAAQKGWDGVGLLVLIAVARTLDYALYNDDRLAATWLRRECVGMKAWKCQFSGRTPMLGTIQLLKSNAISSWMNQILAPSNRREAWLEMLPLDCPDFETLESKHTLTGESDQTWVRNNWLLTRAAVKAIRVATGEGAA